jgi:dTDP-4-dehydrorhamnose reductase
VRSGGTATVLITGAKGQLGRELLDTAPSAWRLIACGSGDLDVTDADAVNAVMERERPAAVIQLAAYTQVDQAETEAEQAEAVNVTGAFNVAAAATRIGARLIHLSTDFVFDGRQGHPYTPDAPTNPLSIYGRTKLRGEQEVIRATEGAALIVRTAWVYSVHGRNFVRTMLRLMQDQPQIRVVHDQVGTPTWGRALAEALWRGADRDLKGIVHWTDAGVASWYDFAVAIRDEALVVGLLHHPVTVVPIGSHVLAAAPPRPPYSVLNKESGWAALGGPARHWRENLRSMLEGLADA